MITEDPQLEMRLRHYGSTVRQEARVSPELHARIIARLGHHAPARPYRMLAQLAAAAAMVLVALGAMGVVLKLRADELDKASPHVTSVFPAAGATHVPLKGEFRVSFSARPSGLAVLRVSPADAVLQPARWVDTTMIVAYAGLHPSAQYELILSADYRDHLGDRGHFEKRWTAQVERTNHRPAPIERNHPIERRGVRRIRGLRCGGRHWARKSTRGRVPDERDVAGRRAGLTDKRPRTMEVGARTAEAEV